jgi:MFS family permease
LTALTALSERPFRLLWLARTTSATGTAFAGVALAFAVLAVGGSAAALGEVLTAGAVIRLGFFLLGGVWADRLPRKQVMIAADLIRLLAQAGAAALLLAGRANVWELMAANVVVSAATSLYRPASTGLLAQTVSAPRLQEANALLSISEGTASFAGPALSGLLVAVAGPGWSFLIDAASFAGSAALLAAMPAFAGHAAAGRRFTADLAEGWRELIAHRWYWLNLISHALWNLAVAAFIVLGPVVARQRLGGAAAWGFISAGMAAGAVAGGVVTLRARPRRPLVAGNLALTLGALPMLALAWRLPLAAAVAGAVLAFMGVSFLNGVWQTAIQQLMPPQVLARVSSYDNLVSYAVMPAGYALAGVAATASGTGPALVAAASFMLVPSALVALAPAVRSVVRHPDGTITRPAPAAHAPGSPRALADHLRHDD